MPSCSRLDRVLATLELFHNLRPRPEQKVRMCVRMVADLMAGSSNLCSQAGILLYVLAQNEKRCPNLMLLQKRQKTGCHGRVRTVVERESARFSNVPNGAPEQLRPGMKCAPCGRRRAGKSGNQKA